MAPRTLPPILAAEPMPFTMKTLRLATLGFATVFVISGFFAAEAEERKTNITRRKYGYPEKKYMDGKFKIFSLGASY